MDDHTLFSGEKIGDLEPLQPLQKAFLQVNTDLNALAQVLEWFDQFNNPPIPYQVWLQCQLALAEGFTNAVRHANKGQADLPVEMEVQVFEEQLAIRIWDHGAPFNMEQKLHSLPQEIDSEAEGGRGLRLMQRIADTLSYTRTADERNCLLIIKRYLVFTENRE